MFVGNMELLLKAVTKNVAETDPKFRDFMIPQCVIRRGSLQLNCVNAFLRENTI